MRGVIFDLDGTLLDSMGMWTQLDQRFLRSHGIEPPPGISDIVKTMTVEVSAAYFVERFSLPITAAEVIKQIEQLAAEEYRLHLQLKPHAAELLEMLAARGIPCALASVTYPALLESALERLDIRRHFRFVITPEAGSAGKHEPAIYYAAAERLGTAPAETVVIEDALYAAKTAKQAGFYTIGFKDPIGAPDWTSLTAVCDRVIVDWSELCTPAFYGMFPAEI